MSIYERQNKDKMILCLKVQRCLYAKAKRISAFKTIITLAGTCTFSILTTVYNNEKLNVVSIFLGLLILLISFLLNKYINYIKRQAAGIQQIFDTYVFQIDVTIPVYRYMGLPDVPKSEKVIALAKKYEKRKVGNLKNWYSNYSYKSRANQILCCQKRNVRWDKSLRIKWLTIISSIYALIFLAIIVIGIHTDSMFTMFSAFAWMLPVIVNAGNSIDTLVKDIKRVDRIENQLFEADKLKANEDKLFKEVSGLQTTIYQHRIKCYMIPDWLYKICRKKMQQEEDCISEEIKLELGA